MNRFQKIKNMTIEDMAREITGQANDIIEMQCRDDFTEAYCGSNCKGSCTDAKELKCCIRWLKEEI
jgi:hypothetical protein